MSQVHPSLWEGTTLHRGFPALQQDLMTDVVVIGAGITGLTLAYELRQRGLKVVVCERHGIGSGTSGQTSAHLSTYWDHGYAVVETEHGLSASQALAQAMQQAIEFISSKAARAPDGADFQWVSGFLYREKSNQPGNLDKEFAACQRAGVDVAPAHHVALPFSVQEAFEVRNQAIFHPLKYLTGLAQTLADQEVAIFENSPVVDFSAHEVTTPRGKIKTGCVVEATHTPLGMTAVQAANPPHRSYVVAGPYGGLLDDSIYWDTEDPYHYVRAYQQEGEHLLLVGGADRRTGHADEDKSFADLARFAEEKFGVKEVRYKWSAQYYDPIDSLPSIGHSLTHKNIYVATGFSGDGLTMGTAAGEMLAGLIVDGHHPWEKHFSPSRLDWLLKGEFYREGYLTTKHMLKDRWPSESINPDNIRRGDGCVVSSLSGPIAYYRDMNGHLITMSAVCTHMKCVVHWNGEEKSFDCPCHGSRFDGYGNVIEGPAMADLAREEEPEFRPRWESPDPSPS